MKKIKLFSKGFSGGKGWFMPLSEFLRDTQFQVYSIKLRNSGLNNLGNILVLLKNDELNSALEKIEPNSHLRSVLELELKNKVLELQKMDKIRSRLIPGLLIVSIVIFFFASTILRIYDEAKNEKFKIALEKSNQSKNSSNDFSRIPDVSVASPSTSAPSYSSKPNESSNYRTYEIVSGDYTFATTENGLKKMLEAFKTNDLNTINLMSASGEIKTFTSGKKVYLVKQGISTIKIQDPSSGLEYYGATESIK